MTDSKDQAQSLFLNALEIPTAGERAAYVEAQCGADPELRKEVEELLDHARRLGPFLVPDEESVDDTISHPITERPGTVIGPYKLLQQIGEGGMGVVFMAEQSEPIQRTVALKIIKPGMDTRQVIARFEAERQAVAMMDHPNIAKVLDAGTTDSGRPYFVMELVKGVPITKYCDDKHLPLRARLELFVQVCQAVQHAHQKGIIHRDIKPNNVLVAEYDNRAVPKVIDFGVAKATAQRLTERTMFTEFGQVLGTMEYMSPEQSKFNQLDIDTRSDIYSLGVLLYELLAGSTPFEGKRLKEAAFDEMLRIIREEDPPKPSTRLSSLSTTSDSLPLAGRAGEGVSTSLASIAANRHTEPTRLSKDVRGELDWIVMKALEKDRNRRYETASNFAADIERHLHDKPVEAGPPSAAYRFRKFARRNKVGVLSGAAVALALAIGFVVATIGFVQASRQAEIAQTEAARSEQVAQFLTDMLDAAGPRVARGRDATLLREILDKTAQRVEKDLPHQPEVQGDLWMTLGKTYADIGDYPRAVMSYQHAVENYRLALGNENQKLAMALGRLGKYQGLSGNSSTGKSNAALGLQMARRCGDNKVIVDCLISKADSVDPYIYVDDATPLYREAIALQKELGDDPPLLADLLLRLAGCIAGPGKHEESESLTRQALALQRQHLDPDHPAITDSLFGLAQSALSLQRFEEAEALAREVVALDRKIYPKDHPSLITELAFLCGVLTMSDKWQEAEAILNEAVQSSPSNSGYWCLLGEFNARRGDLTVAVDQFSRAVELTPNEELISLDLAAALLATGRIEEYRAHCHQFLERSTNTQEVGVADVAAKAALLLPVDGTDFDRACKLADFAATGTEPKWVVPWFQQVKALAEYRRRRFDSAIDWAERASSTADAETACKASALCIQACCYAHLKRMDLARNALTQADQITLQGHDKTREDYYPTWRDWVAVDLLRREAAELIEQQSAPTQTPPPGDKKLTNEDQLPKNSTSKSIPRPTTEP